MRQLLLDTETTGFEPSEGHRIIEFAALEMIDRKLTGNSLHLYFNPERDIPQEATNVHGITMEQVANEAPFRERVDEILHYIEGAELIIHNAKFDLKFLDHHFLELGKKNTLEYAVNAIDTLMMARKKFPGAKNSLDALCDRFRIDRSNRTYHGALIDCELLGFVFLELTKEQISLLADEEVKQQKNKKTYKQINIPNDIVVKVSATELDAHLEYLKVLDKASNGNCFWFNQTKDFIES
ncbi:DNA polymerase III subunit epsilon [Aquella oligotrophica]|uniref:DNA polymerase III subunit epsilon n=1 Tax=Aquella oligotrophica TaxID=2067065 RepID=A0A2I7N5D4_9NEIS|nr:DNA polymerase III subunit epsilon [Aquella oligotrophica]AUR51660.1 DNA polymerase III subunit epsilon [Aquella oligotrophica]